MKIICMKTGKDLFHFPGLSFKKADPEGWFRKLRKISLLNSILNLGHYLWLWKVLLKLAWFWFAFHVRLDACRFFYKGSYIALVSCAVYLVCASYSCSGYIIKDGKEKLIWVLCFIPKLSTPLLPHATQKNADFLSLLFVIIYIPAVSLLWQQDIEWGVMEDKYRKTVFLYFLLTLLWSHSSTKP